MAGNAQYNALISNQWLYLKNYGLRLAMPCIASSTASLGGTNVWQCHSNAVNILCLPKFFRVCGNGMRWLDWPITDYIAMPPLPRTFTSGTFPLRRGHTNSKNDITGPVFSKHRAIEIDRKTPYKIYRTMLRKYGPWSSVSWPPNYLDSTLKVSCILTLFQWVTV